jgi:hypothetical protein
MSATHVDLSSSRLHIPPGTANRWAMVFGGVGLLGLAATASGFFSEGTRLDALSAYLVAFFYVLTLGVGCMFFAALQHLVGARWSVVPRRIAENYGAFSPWLILLFIPIAVFAKDILPWMDIEKIKDPEYRSAVRIAMESKTWYLTVPFFFGRAVLFLIFWALSGMYYYKKSVEVDSTGDPYAILRLRKLAPPTVILFGLTLTFSAFDWLMGVDPTWATTMFGVYAFSGSIVSSLALIACTARTLHGYGYMDGVINDEHYHDLGKLVFAFTVFWAYIAYSMFMLIWYASLPEETVWYRKHWENGWSTLTWTLILLHFVVPFFGLLSRTAKRHPVLLKAFAALLVVMHWVDLYWLVMPLFRAQMRFSFYDFAALAGAAGLFFGVAARTFGKAALVPIRDPHLADSLGYDNG